MFAGALAIGEEVTGLECVAVSDGPSVHLESFGEEVDGAFEGEGDLGRADEGVCFGQGVVGGDGFGEEVEVRDAVGAACVDEDTLEEASDVGGVSTAVEEDACAQADEVAVFVGGEGEVDADGGELGAQACHLIAVEGDFDGGLGV